MENAPTGIPILNIIDVLSSGVVITVCLIEASEYQKKIKGVGYSPTPFILKITYLLYYTAFRRTTNHKGKEELFSFRNGHKILLCQI